MATVPNPQGPMVVHVIREPARSPTNYEDYKARASRALGGILIAIGVVVIVLVSASSATDIEEVNRDFSPVGTGVFFIITGSFLIAASFKKNLCFIVTAMVLSILSAVGMMTVLSWGIRMTVESKNYEDSEYDYENTDWEGCGCFDQYDEYTSTMQTICVDCMPQYKYTYGFPGGIAIGSVVIVAAVAALVVSIVASTLACQIFCCGKRQGQVHQTGFGVPYNYAPQQVLIQNTTVPQYQPRTGMEAEKQPLEGPAVMQVSSVPQLPPAYIA